MTLFVHATSADPWTGCPSSFELKLNDGAGEVDFICDWFDVDQAYEGYDCTTGASVWIRPEGPNPTAYNWETFVQNSGDDGDFGQWITDADSNHLPINGDWEGHTSGSSPQALDANNPTGPYYYSYNTEIWTMIGVYTY